MNVGAFFSGVEMHLGSRAAKKEAKGRHTKSLFANKKLCLDTENSLLLKHNFLLLR